MNLKLQNFYGSVASPAGCAKAVSRGVLPCGCPDLTAANAL